MTTTGSISVNHLWKRFRQETKRVQDDFGATGGLRKAARRARRTEDPWRWALRDASVQVAPGESLGLVGLNGSGKSTLLKILTGAMFPYAGSVAVGGRIGALIEVRSGIHPELTGRENVFLNGTLLGLSRRDVAARFDTIIDFAELGGAVDRQVKYYSSGMQMRLGFSIAAFLEPDVLLVDEALAVGDVGFQQRCLDRMRAVLAQGTTMIFVSHDLMAVEAMCKRALWLDDGLVKADGDTHEVVGQYRASLEQKAASYAELLQDPLSIASCSVTGPRNGSPRTGAALTTELALHAERDLDVVLAVGISEGPAAPIFVVTRELELKQGDSEQICRIEALPLPVGRYYMWAGAWERDGGLGMSWHPVAPVDVAGPPRQWTPTGVQLMSPVYVPATWEERGSKPGSRVRRLAHGNGRSAADGMATASQVRDALLQRADQAPGAEM